MDALSNERALLSLKFEVDADAGTIRSYGKGIPSDPVKGASNGGLVTDYNSADQDSEGYVFIQEIAYTEPIAQLAFSLDKSAKDTPDGAQMTVESVRIMKEVEDAFQYDLDSLTEDAVLNGQSSSAVTGMLNLPQTLACGTKVEWSVQPDDGTVDVQTGQVTPPESGSVDVTLTAHLTELEGAQRQEQKEFPITVVAKDPAAASGWVAVVQQDTFDTLSAVREVYTTSGESSTNGELLLQDGKPSLKRLGVMNAGDPVYMVRDIGTLDSGKYVLYIDTKQAYQGNYKIYLRDADGTDKYIISRSYYGDVTVQTAGESSITWGPEFRNTGALSEEKALLSLKLVVDADANTVSVYGKGTPSNPTKNAAGSLVPDYDAAPKDEEGYVTIKEDMAMGQSSSVAKLAFQLEKSTKDTPDGAQMTVESVRVMKEVDDVFQYDRDSLTEDVVLNGQNSGAVTAALNLPQTLAGGTKVEWSVEPDDGTVDVQTGQVTPPENGSVDVTLNAHLTENVQGSPRTAELTFSFTVVATQTTLLSQTTYDNEESFRADYTVTGAETDAAVSLVDGKPAAIRQGANTGENVELSRSLPEMESGVYAIYVDVRQAYQGNTKISLLQDGAALFSIDRNYWGNLQSSAYPAFTYPSQFRGTGDFNAAAALLQFKFLYVADTGRLKVYLKGSPTSAQDQYNAAAKEEEGYTLFHEEAVDIGSGNTIDGLAFTSSKGAKDTAGQSGFQIDQVKVVQTNYDVFQDDVNSLTETLILNGQEKDGVREALNLPQTLGYGSPVTWSASPEGIVDPQTGAVTRPNKLDTDVKLTAVISEVGGEQRQEQKEFTVKVISYETDNPTPTFGWATLLEQPSYADEAALKEDYIMPSSTEITTGLYEGAPYIIRNVANSGSDASMIRSIPALESGKYLVYVDTLQAYRGSIKINLKSGNTSRLTVSRNHFGNIQKSSSTYATQFRCTAGFDDSKALLSFKFVVDADTGLVDIYLKGTPSNTDTTYANAPKDEEGYAAFLTGQALSGSGTIDTVEILSTKGASSDTAGQSGVAVPRVAVKRQLTDAFEADVYSLSEESVLNGQPAQEIRNALNLVQTLPYGTTVQWSVQPEGAVNLETGEVTRQEYVNTNVTLQAVLTEQGVETPRTETKTFQIMVLSREVDREALEIVEFDKKVLDAGEFLSEYSTVTLPVIGAKGSNISWESSSDLVKIDSSGKATITAPTEDTVVTLTATLSRGVIFTTKPFTFTLKPSTRTNLALGKYESSTGTVYEGYEGQYAVDGYRDTAKGHRWATKDLEVEYVLNFGSPQTFNKVVVYDGYSRLTSCTVQVKQGEEWIDVAAAQGPGTNDGTIYEMSIPVAEQTAQYVRLKFQGVKEISITEIEVYQENTETLSWDTTKAMENLTARSISEDDLMALASLKTLPQTDAQTGASIQWVSTNEEVINPQTGTLTRPSGADELVQLFAIITKEGQCERVKRFVVNVLGQRQGMHYFVEEPFDSERMLQDKYWMVDGSAQLENGKLAIASGGSVSASLVGPGFTNTRSVRLQAEWSPTEEGAVRFLDADGNVVLEAAVTKTESGWMLEYNGMRAYSMPENGVQRFYLDFLADLNTHMLLIKVNGNTMASNQPIPEGANLASATFAGAGILDNVKSITDTGSGEGSLLQMIASQAGSFMMTEQPAEAISKNLTLSSEPLTGIGCIWSSSAPDIIAADGTVTRKNGDGADTVTLTGTFYLLSAPETTMQAQIVLQVAQVGTSGINGGKATYSNAQPLKGSSLDLVNDSSALTAFITDGFGDATEILFHMGGEVAFSHIVMQEQQVNGAYNIANAVVEVSNDRSRWTKIAQTDGVGQMQDLLLEETVKATYVRFSFTKKADGPIAIAELLITRGGNLSGPNPETDLEEVMAKLPANYYLTDSFTVPLTGESGSGVTIVSDNAQAAKVTKGSESWQVQITRLENVDQSVTFTVTCSADGAADAQKSRTYSVQKTSTSSGGGSSSGGGGGNSGGGSGGSAGGTGGGGGGSVVAPPVSTPQPTEQPEPTDEALYHDLADAQWAVPYIQALTEAGAISGDQDGNFHPNSPATREEFVKILVCAIGAPVDTQTEGVLPFTDVEQNAWYYPYLVAAYQMNLIQGVSATEFGIGQTISRQDMATVIYRQLNPEGQTVQGSSSFADSSLIADWAKDAVWYLESEGILSGDEQGNFNPWNATTKAEVAKVVCSILD